MVGISGLGTGENGKGQPSGAHDNLPSDRKIVERILLTRHAGADDLEKVIDSLECDKGLSQPERPGLMIMVNSWGSQNGYRLAKLYKERCHEEVDFYVAVDGVSSILIKPFSKKVPAKKCMNFYQTKSTVNGGPIDGCQNMDLSDLCEKGGIATCHIDTEWNGSRMGANEIKNFLKYK